MFVGLLGGGLMIARHTDRVNESMMHRILENRLPQPFPYFVEGVRILPEKRPVCHCTIIEVKEKGVIVVEDPRTGKVLRFVLDPKNRNATTSGLVPGDTIIIASDRSDGDGDQDDMIGAYGLRKVEHGDDHRGRGRGRGGEDDAREVEVTP